jgi:hypothetical protein
MASRVGNRLEGVLLRLTTYSRRSESTESNLEQAKTLIQILRFSASSHNMNERGQKC